MIYNWDRITPSTNVSWAPCFNNFTCTRLQVPLDYGDVSLGSTAIAFIKYPAKNITKDTQNIVINPGGPGGPGADPSLISSLTQITGPQHNIIGFDPRGVGHSGPTVDCWPGHPEKRAQFEKLLYPETSNASSTALQRQFYSAELFGEACTPVVGGSRGNASFISTPAVAEDLFTYIKAEQVVAGKPKEDAKLAYYGASYGTVLGATFAHRFPDHVGRMILDGVVDPADYYELGWKENLHDTDKSLNSFVQNCYQGGPKNCSFWGPSVRDITSRFDAILADLKENPKPVLSSAACDLPLLATYSDLKQLALQALYIPVTYFPQLADVLSGLERGNATAYMNAVAGWSIPANPCNNGTAGSTVDVNTLIRCVDGIGSHKFTNLSQYRDYVETLTKQSRYFGEVWPTNALGVACRSLDVEPPKSARLEESILLRRNTSFPILFVTQKIDPVAPSRNAHKMSKVFSGSVVLTQDSVGHTAIVSASECLTENIQAYFSGQLPSANTTCQSDMVPFQVSSGVSISW
ncbi:hypothetical protein AWENTII_012769 [Aspergillus wentii]